MYRMSYYYRKSVCVPASIYMDRYIICMHFKYETCWPGREGCARCGVYIICILYLVYAVAVRCESHISFMVVI